MTNIRRALEAAAAGGGDPVYVEDVFSTYVYIGNDSTQTIVNGIDLDGEGGMVWIKARDDAGRDNVLFDTERGVTKYVSSNTTEAQSTVASSLTAFNSNGFSISDWGNLNGLDDEIVSWTFRKAPGFFDVVTYTGDGANRTIAHNLESVPGMIIVKRLDTAGFDWPVYHRGMTSAVYRMLLNESYQEGSAANFWNSTAPTDAVFSLGTNTNTNATGGEYIAYLFAHDDQIFGADEDESIIKCGSFSTSSSPASVNLGWEPQWLLVKNATTGASWDNWFMVDNMRGVATGGTNVRLRADTSAAEQDFGDTLDFRATGFDFADSASETYIYMAIRRGPMKVPTAGTEVYLAQTANSTSPGPLFSASFPVDMIIWKENITAAGTFRSGARLVQGSYGVTNDTSSWVTDSAMAFDYSYGWRNSYGVDANDLSWMFGRAPEFMDVVCYTGNDGTNTAIPHGLGVVPEMIIVKNRNGSTDWACWTAGLSGTLYYIRPNGNQAEYNQTTGVFGTSAATATNFYVDDTGNTQITNDNGDGYVAYLFATLAGVSKVGSYTADATLTTIDCGFSAGARFILIKRIDASGDWYLYDSVRGIVAGDDPYARPNEALAQVTNTDWIDPDNSGFQITAEVGTQLNKDTGTYIFLAIA